MESVSTRLDDETVRDIREAAEERDVSMAEVLRELVEKGREYDGLERENDRLRQRVAALIQQREEHDELVEYVEDERQLARQRAEAPVWERAKWWVFGQSDE